MKAGETVRLKSDPSRIGILTGEEQIRGGRRRIEVRFDDSEYQFYLEDALEYVPRDANNPYALFRQGRYGHLRDLRGALTYYRLSGKLANLIYSMDTTNTEFYAYQFKPVLCFLESPNHGILIADEVGLGKTIEAGLIWTELRSRFDARRLLVICPAILREKWKAELSERFGVIAEICSAKDLLETLRSHLKGDLHEFASIASIQGIRPPRKWDDDKESVTGNAAELARLLDELASEDPVFDLVIIDEAHYLRNPESQTAEMGSLVRQVCDGLVMLSATPIQLKSEDLFHQVKYLDEVTFDHEYSFQLVLDSSRPLVDLRDRLLRGQANSEHFIASLHQAQQYQGLKNSQQIQYLLDHVPDESDFTDRDRRSELADMIDRINPLSHVVNRTRKRDVNERRVVREPQAIRVPMTAEEEEFYWAVTDRVRAYCLNYDLLEGFLLTIPQRQMTSSMPAACRAWLKKSKDNVDEELLFEGLAADEETQFKQPKKLGPLILELIEIARDVGDYQTLRKNDSKYYLLIKNISGYWSRYPDKKIILFSFYRETLAYLNERLTEEGISTLVLWGGMDKHQALQKFKDPSGPRLLLASEVASEGIDLQFCSLLINYDLPWNPQRIEQRIGRIDRIGQKEEIIHIWNLFHADTLDDRVYSRLLDRLGIFQAALGSIESVLGEDIRRMTYELFFSHKLNPEQELQVIEQTAQALANRRIQEERLEEEASHLVAHGDYIQNKVNAARELKRYVTGEDIYSYVRDFFDDEFPGCRFNRVTHDELLFQIDLSGDAKAEFSEFLRRWRMTGKTRLVHATNKMQFRFENRAVLDQTTDEIISQFHPVIRFISERYRAKGVRQYFPVVGVELSNLDLSSVLLGVYIFSVQRWSIKVALRDIEKLVYQVYSLAEEVFLDREMGEQLVNTAVHQGQDWLAAQNEVNGNVAENAFGLCEDALETQYQEFVDSMARENSDRIAFQISNLDAYFEKKEWEWNLKIDFKRSEETPKSERAARSLEGKLEKLRQRTEDKKIVISKSSVPTHEAILVCSGVIRVF